MVDVRGIGEIGGVVGGAIAKGPYPLFEVALPRRVAAQVGEMGDAFQAIWGIGAEKSIGVRQHAYRMGNCIMAAIGINNAERYGVGAVCRVHMARAVWGAVGGVGAIAKIPVPGAGHLQVIPRKGEESGVAITRIIGGKIRNRCWVHDHIDRIFHNGNAITQRVLALHRILPG